MSRKPDPRASSPSRGSAFANTLTHHGLMSNWPSRLRSASLSEPLGWRLVDLSTMWFDRGSRDFVFAFPTLKEEYVRAKGICEALRRVIEEGTAENDHIAEGRENSPGETNQGDTARLSANDIDSALEEFSVTESKAWKALSKELGKVAFFAFDPRYETFQIAENGDVIGEVGVLISHSHRFRSGRRGNVSRTLTGRVRIARKPSGAIVEDFSIER